jgi:hypothetical protein
LRQAFALSALLQMDGAVDEVDIVRIDRLDELQDLRGIDIRIDADQMILRQQAAELDKLRVVKRFAPGEMKIPTQAGIVEEPGQLLDRSRRIDFGAEESVGVKAIGAPEIAGRHEAPIGLDVVWADHRQLAR